MGWVSIIAILILFFSFIGGLKKGAIKNFFSVIALIIAMPLAGLSYRLITIILSLLPGTNWENFIGFFITLGLIIAILYLILLLPRKIIHKAWHKGGLFRLLGGTLNVLNASIGMVVFTLALVAYPIIGWLELAVVHSGVIIWLVTRLSFVQALLPDLFQDEAIAIIATPILSLASAL